jgi:hypothetical protein
MKKQLNVYAYTDFLLQSELAKGIKAEYILREPLARAIMEVLTAKGIISRDDVMKKFNEFVNEELISHIDPDDLEKNPERIPLKLDFSK